MSNPYKLARLKMGKSIHHAARAARLSKNTIMALERGEGGLRSRQKYAAWLKLRVKVSLTAASLLLALWSRAQVVAWSWPLDPCPEVLACDSGVAVCNKPVHSIDLTGSAAVWHGAVTCPQAMTATDGAVKSWGWDGAVDTAAYLLLELQAPNVAMAIDTLRIRCMSDAGGPQWVQVNAGVDEPWPAGTLTTIFGAPVWTDFVATNVGTVPAGSYLRILIRPYFASGGAWWIDQVQVAGHPAIGTGIADHPAPHPALRSTKYDLLGRMVR